MYSQNSDRCWVSYSCVLFKWTLFSNTDAVICRHCKTSLSNIDRDININNNNNKARVYRGSDGYDWWLPGFNSALFRFTFGPILKLPDRRVAHRSNALLCYGAP